MDGKKEGVSVKEIEDFARKHRFEVFFCLLFILAAIFNFFSFFKAGWSILLSAVGGCLSVAFPTKVDSLLKKMFQFLFKQDATLQLVLGVVCLIIAVFLPPVIFVLMGLFGGRYMYQMAMDSSR
jgi:hypothetical protein